MAERDFDSDRKKRKGHKFTLAGRIFHAYPGLSLTFFMADEDETIPPLTRTLDFIRSQIVDTDRPAWDEMLADSTVYLESDDIIELSRWLLEVAAGRPTKRPPSSANGAGQTASPSKASSSATPASASKTSRAKKPTPSAT